MFAVKGWNLSADELKPEKPSPPTGDKAAKSRKRKRGPASSQEVTASNVAELWEKFIEHKETQSQAGDSKSARGQKQKQKRQKSDNDSSAQTAAAEGVTSFSKEERQQKKKDRKKDKKGENKPENGKFGPEDSLEVEKEWAGLSDGNESHQHEPPAQGKESSTPEKDKGPQTAEKLTKTKLDRKNKKARRDRDVDDERSTAVNQTQLATAATAPEAGSKSGGNTTSLTPLQAAMREKLVSARFRHINEALYTRPSADAFTLFQDSPEMFAEYHEGFRRQVGIWPENPVTGYIADVKARGKLRFPPRRSGGGRHGGGGDSDDTLLPLPRTNGTCTIADLGCGDAALAAALQPVARRLHLAIKSFDLQSTSPLVTRADVTNLPLPDGSVDVAVFCLALMGTNWIDFIEEAYRVLHWKGELWVAEIKSRFAGAGGQKKKKQQQQQRVVEHSVGNRKKAPTGSKKGKDEGAAEETALAVEVDGAEDRRQETDVSAFVEALRRRGFVLRGEPAQAVDLRNKMFVKMYFVKGAPATKGKGVVARPGGADVRGAAMRMKKKFLPSDDEDAVDESAILKPCVYKLR